MKNIIIKTISKPVYSFQTGVLSAYISIYRASLILLFYYTAN